MMDARIRLLLEVCDQAFGGHSWHGTTLSGSLRGVTAGQALWRPGQGRGGHNIWEITLHAAYWKCIVRRRLTRDPALKFPRPRSNWPELPERPDEGAWRRDVARSEEHTSELQSLAYLVCRLLLEKKKKMSLPRRSVRPLHGDHAQVTSTFTHIAVISA